MSVEKCIGTPKGYNFQANGETVELSNAEFNNLVEVFRTLARWQQELDANKAKEEPQEDSRTRNDLIAHRPFR